LERTLLYNCTIIDPASGRVCPDGLLVLEHGNGPDAPDKIGYCGPLSGGPDKTAPLPEDTWLDCEGGALLPGLCDLDPRFCGGEGAYAALRGYRAAGAALLRGLTCAGVGDGDADNALRRASDEMLLWAPKLARPAVPEGAFLLSGVRDGPENILSGIGAAARAGLLPLAACGCALLPNGELAAARAACLLAEGGYPPMDALRAVTCNGAAALGFGGTNGRLASGYEGDVLLVRGDPLDDPETLCSPVMAARGGRLIVSRLKAMERTRLALLPPGYEL